MTEGRPAAFSGLHCKSTLKARRSRFTTVALYMSRSSLEGLVHTSGMQPFQRCKGQNLPGISPQLEFLRSLVRKGLILKRYPFAMLSPSRHTQRSLLAWYTPDAARPGTIWSLAALVFIFQALNICIILQLANFGA